MNFHDDLAWITHTHSDYFDCTNIYQSQMLKYLGDTFFDNHLYLTDRNSSSGFTLTGDCFYYDPSLPYPSRLLSVLSNLSTEHVFLDHEDMFLLGKPDLTPILNSFAYMKEINASSLRFVRTSVSKYVSTESTSCIKALSSISLRSSWIFSIQPSIWKRSDLISVLTSNPSCNIWQLEERSQNIVKGLNQQHLVLCSPSEQRGSAHFDPVEYPHIATAIFKGKWTLSEHRELLGDVLNYYGIDPTVRGIV